MGIIEQLFNYGMAFIYRTVFLSVLSKSYLGLSGLFTNVLQVFSLAELGIGAVIAFRMYAPVKEQDIYKCSQLLSFYKSIYRIISLIILAIGLLFFPFLDFIIKDPGEIPADINIYLIYGMFVFQNVSSYFFIYYQSLLTADQKGYVISTANTVSTAMSYILRIVLLLITKNYTLVLCIGIVFNVIYNFVLGQYIKHAYSEIVNLKTEKLSREEKKQIFIDTGSLMCHKVGYTVVNSTDSILISKFIGIGVVGLYSNYSMIATAIDVFINKLFGSFVPTIGRYLLDNSEDEAYLAYRRMRFLNFWVASFCTVSLYVLIDPFVILWLGESFLLDRSTVIIISANIFLNSSRVINVSFVNASGLFVRDRIRPLIQAALNLIFSVIFVKLMGIGGIFLGTVLSMLLTVWWREGFIIYGGIFKRSVKEYFFSNAVWIIVTFCSGVVFSKLCSLFDTTLLGFILKMAVCTVGVNVLYFIAFYNTAAHKYFREKISYRIKRKR